MTITLSIGATTTTSPDRFWVGQPQRGKTRGDPLGSRPRHDAPGEVRAAWFDHRAALFDQIRAAGGPDAAEAARLAGCARAEAQRIRRGWA
jgi:hypothetical protein